MKFLKALAGALIIVITGCLGVFAIVMTLVGLFWLLTASPLGAVILLIVLAIAILTGLIYKEKI